MAFSERRCFSSLLPKSRLRALDLDCHRDRALGGAFPATPVRLPLCQTSGNWTFSSPEGRTENSPGLSALGRHPQRNHPERVAEWRASFPEITFVESDSIRISSESRNGRRSFVEKTVCTIRWERDWDIKYYNSISIRSSQRLFGRPFRAILFGSVPRPEGLGYSLLALRAIGTWTRKCPNCGAQV